MRIKRSSRTTTPPKRETENNNVRHEALLRIPECMVHLMDEGEALELAAGESFELVRLLDERVALATTIRVVDELQWPLTKDGKTVLSLVPGEALLASLDAVDAAEKQTMTATSGAVTMMVTSRYGESSGEATGDALTTAGHCAGTAWNVLKIRKAINPASPVSSGTLKNSAKPRITR